MSEERKMKKELAVESVEKTKCGVFVSTCAQAVPQPAMISVS
jgi:hypothetical protein